MSEAASEQSVAVAAVSSSTKNGVDSTADSNDSTKTASIAKVGVGIDETGSANSQASFFVEPNQADIHNATVYAPGNSTPEAISDYDDSIYEMTANKAKAYHSLLVKKSQRLSDGGPLLTKQLRQKQEDEKRAHIEKVEIRVRFPDQTQLLGTFKATDTVQDLWLFVQERIVDPMLPFYLFITPPRKVLSDLSQTLVPDLKFNAREMVLFAWDLNELSKRYGSEYPVPKQALKPEILKHAEDLARLRRKELEKKQQEEQDDENERKKAQKKSSSGHTLGGSLTAKKPAWFKLNNKK
ncbi:hypothetical protein V1514DRAFT_42558 [Lipomyces japonicus]|uniref:uncharacterized protein n=1 Tax=Lipomyces japonicus TaxID=56871 RepID=UPI0034CFCC4B